MIESSFKIYTLRKADHPNEWEVQTLVQLHETIDLLSQRFYGSPILLMISCVTGRIQYGVGAEYTSIHIFPLGSNKSFRARPLQTDFVPDQIEFTYSGEWTGVDRRFLVSAEKGKRALDAWLLKQELVAEIDWATAPFPPGRRMVPRPRGP